MPSQQTDQLIQLIHSLTKAEKRSFRLYVNRDNHANDKLYMQLFDFIDQSKKYNEDDLLKKLPQIKKSQLSNIKANLLKQVLTNLRHLQRNDVSDISIRELLDYAKIMQAKGLTKACLDLLDKAKKLAIHHQETILLYQIIDEERKIETQYITGNSIQKAIQINEESKSVLNAVKIHDQLSNLSLMLYGMYLKYGYIKSKEDYKKLQLFFTKEMPDVQQNQLGFYERIYFYQSHVWFNHMTQNFVQYYKYSQKWVDEFHQNEHLIKNDLVLYFKGLHNALNALYMANKTEKFIQQYATYVHFGELHLTSMSETQKSNYILFKYVHLLNQVFLEGKYDEAIPKLSPLKKVLKKNEFHWDVNREMVFYYKIACVYFGADDYNNAIEFLNKITNSPIGGLREDIQCFARFLSLISHFELGNEVLVSYQIKSVYRFLTKMEDMQAVQREILNFVRRTPQMRKSNLKSEFIILREKLDAYQNDDYEKRPFLYLDIISWLDSKIHNKRIQVVIQEKMQNYK